MQEHDPLGELSAAFSFKSPSIAPAEMVILRVDSLALWKIIIGEDVVLIPKNRGEKFSSEFLHSEIFGVG